MRKWTMPPSKCLLCAFNVANSSRIAPVSTRAWFGTTTASRLRTSSQPGRVIPRRLDGSVLRPKGGPRILFGKGNPTSGDIYRDLEAVREQLALSEYDTTGPLWEQFCSEVQEAAGEGELDFDRSLPKFQKDLLAAAKKGSSKNFLQCAFIDRTLESTGHSINKALGQVADLRYPTEWYIRARSTQRDIHLHIGPTNSGKTYNALKRLEEAGTGFYAGPLRLLAHEVYSRFKAKGLRCDLVTGDDVRLDDEEDEAPKLVSSTVEMADVHSDVAVAVIDEIQMMADDSRGWAWTRAFIGTCAQEVHLCGENRVLPLVQELTASMGDTLHVHEYQRLNELKCMSRSFRGDLSNLRPGDAVVCFSIVQIHSMKKAIEERTGRRVAIVYGSLPPETRAQQAALFNDPDNDYDYLVASDAIGMGLNLSIKRVIFESVWKYNGSFMEQLSVPQIKQIAGRAGRFRTARDATRKESSLDARDPKEKKSVGLVTTMDEADLPIIRSALETEAEPITTAGLLPPGDFIEDFAARLPANTPHDYVLQRLSEAATVHPRFTLCGVGDQLNLARIIEPVRELTTSERHIFTASPFSFTGNDRGAGAALAFKLAQCIGNRQPTCVTEIAEIPLELLEKPLINDGDLLHQLEYLHKALILYLWLSYRMSTIFKDQDMAFHAKEMVEARINAYLETFSDAKRSSRRKRPMSDVLYRGSAKTRYNPNSQKTQSERRLVMDESGSEDKSRTKRQLLSDDSVPDHDVLAVLAEPDTFPRNLDAKDGNAALPIDWNSQATSSTFDGAANTHESHRQIGEKPAGDA